MRNPAVDSTKMLRQALGTFATGVTIVTTIDTDGRPRGFTANSFTSVSLDPPLVLVCLSTDAASCPVFTTSNHFCINVLAEDQQDTSALFAAATTERFENVSWRSGKRNCPIVEGALSWFECERHDVIAAGDHMILIGRVLHYETSNRSPLIYCSGSYVELGLLQKAVEGASRGASTRVSAIVECAGRIPMARDAATEKLSLPTAERVGGAGEAGTLTGKLAANGIRAAMPFVYSVYEDARCKTHNVVYRGAAESIDTSMLKDFELVSLQAIPWDSLIDNSLKTLLERYIEESERDAFGLYVGDAEHGAVHTLQVHS